MLARHRASSLLILGFLLCTQSFGQFGDLLKPGKKQEKKEDTTVKVKLPPYYGPKKRIAVQDFEIKINPSTSAQGDNTNITPPTDFGQGLTEMLMTALVNSGRFIVLERSEKGIADMQREQTLQGAAPNGDQAKAMGAQLLVRGSVVEFSFKSSRDDTAGNLLKGFGMSTAKSEAIVGIDLKLFDSATGEIFDSKKAEGVAKTAATSFNLEKDDLKFGNTNFQQSPLGKATRQAIEKAVLYICDSMSKRPWEGRVATVVDEGQGNRLYLNAGSRAGLKIGDEFDVFSEGVDVTDPDTGKVISHTKGRRLGHCVVESVDDNIAVAKPTEGEGFAAKNYIRFVEKELAH